MNEGGQARHPIRLTVTGHEGYAGGSTIEAFVGQLERVVQIVWDKNKQYGDAWREQGWMGNVARILSKSARIKNMLWADFVLSDANESVEDTLQDLVALSVFCLLNRGQENRWGNRG